MKNKKESSYSIVGNIAFIMKKAWSLDKLLLFSTFIKMPTVVLIPLLATYTSGQVVSLITDGVGAARYTVQVVLLSSLLLVLQLMQKFVESKLDWRAFGNRFEYINLCCGKTMDTDYENIESPAGQEKMERAFNSVWNNSSGTQQIFSQFVSIVSNLLGLVTYSAIIITLHPMIAVLLAVVTLINYFVTVGYSKWVHRNMDNWVVVDRKLRYIQNKSVSFESAKDVRLNGMAGWFYELSQTLFGQRYHWEKVIQRRSFGVDAVKTLLVAAGDLCVYGYLFYSTTRGEITPAEFVMYFGIISQYAGWLGGIIGSYGAIHATSLNLCDLRGFLDMPDRFNRGEGAALPTAAPEIEFDDVSFRYPSSDRDTIKHVSLKIRAGEKVAIIGLNGAGKTTLIKLLCGLYKPTSGSVRVAGRDISEYNRDEYYKLFSVVFQDIFLLPVSVEKNIALCDEDKVDRARLQEVLEQSGLSEKVSGLKHGEKTLLLKTLNEDAVDFSGGEKQKLALARALYKNGSIVVLDEPTAALDPIAENSLYMKYNELTSESTSVFISHRLSSTRFCDRILFLEDGRIAEEGSHDELMKAGGRYRELFELQSRYYREDPSDESIEE